MTDIRLGAETMDARGIGQKNADIMEHGRLLREERVGIELGMTCYDAQRLVSHISAMENKNIFEFLIVSIIFIYQLINQLHFLSVCGFHIDSCSLIPHKGQVPSDIHLLDDRC